MFEASARLAGLQLQHRHTDGSWSSLQPADHDAAASDPERDWVNGAIYVCTSCPEEVRITQRPEASKGDTT